MASIIGTDPNQVPTNADLGTMAYQDYDVVAPILKGGRRNFIINGGFDVWQRGTTGSGPTGYWSADRWKHNAYGNGTFSLTKKTDATGVPFTTYGRYEQEVAGTETGKQATNQYIEGNYLVGKTATVSFYARASKVVPDAQVRMIFSKTHVFTVTTEWQKFTFTDVVQNNSGNVRFNIDMLSEDDTWWFDLAQVQVEEGSVATPFEHRSYGEELQLCQRYFQQSSQAGGNPYNNGYVPIFKYNSGGDWYGAQEFPVTMRAAPTMTTSIGSSGTWGMWWSGTGTASLTSGLATCEGSSKGFYFYCNNNVSTVGYGGMTTHGDGSNGYRWEWFADAEL
jgi:hypothetical protein